MEGEDSYHFSLEIDKEESKQLFKDLIRVVYEKSPIGENNIKGMESALDEALEKIEISDIEMWIGKKSRNLYKISTGFSARDNKNKKEEIKISTSLAYKNFNEPVNVEAPQNAMPFEEIFKNLMGGMIGVNSVLPPCDKFQQDENKDDCLKAKKIERDNKRISEINIIQMALELYFDANESYPDSLDKITPVYIEKIPTDPLDNKPYFYNVHVSDGINTFVNKGEFDGYHIGVSLEDKDNNSLKNDKDCNSITAFNCNFKSGYRKKGAFNGSDLQGCGGEKNRYCYDRTE